MWSRQVIWSCASGQHILKQTRLNASLEMYGNLGARNDRQYFRQPPHRSRKFYVQKHVDPKNKSRINDSERRKPAHAQLRMHLLRPNQPKNNSNKFRMQRTGSKETWTHHVMSTICKIRRNFMHRWARRRRTWNFHRRCRLRSHRPRGNDHECRNS